LLDEQTPLSIELRYEERAYLLNNRAKYILSHSERQKMRLYCEALLNREE
jgi:hypothetical protein